MGKRKKIKLGLFDILFLGIAAAGFVFALIGILIKWFSKDVVIGDASGKLFDKVWEASEYVDAFPIGVVRAFAVIAVILSGLCAIGVMLKVFDIVSIRGLLSFIFAGATIAVGILVAVFSYAFAGDIGNITSTVPVVGMYFCAIGTIASGAAMLLKRG